VQVKRYAVQTAVTEKLRSLLRVPITLSLKNCVADNVVMPVPWSPQRYVLLPLTPIQCVCNRPHIHLVPGNQLEIGHYHFSVTSLTIITRIS
jgi:hypothetical protein